ncbi:MAG TPA: uroporphyrinogen-III C-methyltransferase [Candidatus Sulfotelmatobacter sp.]|nr:uroporphyrinogen-III C-methyltransferase [Candidatus Sulfotelmatobacter sp.]
MTTEKRGTVYLVGAGPGDPELLTLKAHALLKSADFVLHDDLVSPQIVALAGPHAITINVGKRFGVKKITQAEINRLMVASAERGLNVVRLKSGDPAILGRLAEELDALEAARVAFEVVPGVTASLGAAAALGVSLTDRRKTSRIMILSGHHADGREAIDEADLAGLAREDTTLLIYMPGRDFEKISRQLLHAGLPPDTPSVVVSRATTPNQRVFAATLADLASLKGIEAPAILLIGRALAPAVMRASRAEESNLLVDEIAREIPIAAATTDAERSFAS